MIDSDECGRLTVQCNGEKQNGAQVEDDARPRNTVYSAQPEANRYSAQFDSNRFVSFKKSTLLIHQLSYSFLCLFTVVSSK